MSGKINLKKFRLAGLDTNIFVYQFERHPQFGPRTNEIFSLLLNDQLYAVTNFITLVELLSFPAMPSKIDELCDLYFRTPNLRTIEVNQLVALGAAKIRREYGFRLPDSIQLATSLVSKANVFITNDKRLKKFKDVKVVLLTELMLRNVY